MDTNVRKIPDNCHYASTLPSYSVRCPAGLAPNPVATVVTSYLHTPSKRPAAEYLPRMTSFFQLEASVVAFVDYAYVQRAEAMVLKPNATIIVPISFAQFRSLACGLRVWMHEHAVDPEHKIHAPTLYPVWTEKATMLAEAARADCFGSRLFVWLDVGYFIQMPVPPGPFPTKEGANSVSPGKVLLLAVSTKSIQHIADTHFDTDRTLLSGVGNNSEILHVAAGGFAGDKDAVLAWEGAYLRMLDRYRARGWFAGKEQNLYVSVCVETPGLCTMHDSEGRWHDMVPLLRGKMGVQQWQPASVGGVNA